MDSSDKIITSGGISAGIDMSLHVVERLLGQQTRAMVEEEMEYGPFASATREVREKTFERMNPIA